MIKVLAIGNSFSEDALYYLHQIGEASGIENTVVNLFIGGCPLERHWKNIEGDCIAYQYQVNGVPTEREASIRQVLTETDWDLIVTQQASPYSGWVESYEPFLGLMLNYIKKMQPNAKLLLHETWAYEKNSRHDNFMRYNRDQNEMHRKVTGAYTAMSEKYGLPLIKSGELFDALRKTPYFDQDHGAFSICHEDGTHAGYLYGRYALGCIWAQAVFGIDITQNTYSPASLCLPLDKPDPDILNAIKKAVSLLK